MKCIGLDGKRHNWPMSDNSNGPRAKTSEPHSLARAAIKRVFPSFKVYEEVFIPGAGKPLYLDFYIPMLDIAVEVHGEQHYKQNGHFHKNRLDFVAGVKRDSLKRQWCETNGIELIELPYNEDFDQWKIRLQSS